MGEKISGEGRKERGSWCSPLVSEVSCNHGASKLSCLLDERGGIFTRAVCS